MKWWLSVAAFVVAVSPAMARDALDFAMMESGKVRRSVDLSAFAPTAEAKAPSHRFEGRLKLIGNPSTRTLIADKDFLRDEDIRAARTFPQDFDFEFVQHGDALIPVRRGPIPGKHAWWEFVLEPGKVWDEAGDKGYTRAAIPFALVQKNANCTHNGVLMILFRDDGVLANAAVQISSETCQYLQFDLWGSLKASYTPQSVADRAGIVSRYESEVANRLPTRPLSALSEIKVIDLANLAIGDASASTRHGVVFKGIHYVSSCSTRHGDYPYCDVLDVPSFSVAKSVVASIGLMRMEKLTPGIKDRKVGDVVLASGCRREDWRDVTLVNLLDMATGHYNDPAYMVDEDSADVVRFFRPVENNYKLAFACEVYPRKQAPGQRWVYHTADTYLLGVALQTLLRAQPDHVRGDVFNDVVDADIYAPLKLSPTIRVTRRSYDSAAQPFFGWGLTMHADDMAKLANFLNVDRGRIDGKPMLDQTMLDAAMQRDPEHGDLQAAHLESYRYQHGFWARNLQKELGCDKPTWVPFMSGFGGINVVMFPNGATWYNIADDGKLTSINFAKPAIEIAKLGGYCVNG
ncbi:MAG: serine hydrolase [Dokdonella sp.]